MEQSSDNGGDGTEGQWQSRRLRTTKRSRKGCPQCRRRKIKCDERQPRCGQCQKRNRSCHLQDSVFKQHALSAEVNAAVAAEPIRGEVDDTTFVGHDQSSTRVDVTSPSVGLDSPRASSLPAPLGIEYLHSVRPVDQIPIHHIPESLPLAGAAEHGNVENLHRDNSLLHGGDGPWFPPNIDHQDIGPAVSPVTTTSVSGAASTIASLKDTQEELFLLRHYSEFIAPWMDLLYRYEVFSREVLTLARQHPILRYAACAVAAKQLGQMRSPVSTVLRGKTQESIAAKLIVGRLSFVWYGIKYYEKAIQTLVKSITPKDPQTTQSADNQASPAVSLSRGDLMVRAEGEDPIVRLLGTCILIQYEHLSANRDAWSGHLTGFSKLLDLIDDGKLLQQHPIFEQVYPWTKDIMEVKASFWNFVVNDIEESFLSHRRTRIDTENLALWRNMGLLIEDDGRLALTSGPNSLSTTPEHARDKVLSYTLMRLLCKLIDYLAPSSDWESLLPHEETSAATRGKTAFLHLEDQFDKWFQMLSPSFHPDGSFLTPGDDGVPTSRLFSRELWFSNDLCSTTMMYYHMARMLLLVHRPPDLIPAASPISRDTSFDLLRTFRNVERKLQLHASEVISVVRGTPCDAVKLRAIQPLYVAGRCCVVTTDRKMLLEMLTDIQDSLGIATGYRIQALLEEWGASYQDFGMEARLTAEEQLP